MPPHHPLSPLFPYTTLFRSVSALIQLSQETAPLLEKIPQLLRSFVAERNFADYVFLAQGPLFGIASECMLKVTESSCAYAQDRKSTRLNSSHRCISYAVFCL